MLYILALPPSIFRSQSLNFFEKPLHYNKFTYQLAMHPQKITWIQCYRLWWRFALCFLGTLLICSLTTHIILMLSTSLTATLSTPPFPQNNKHFATFGPINSSLLHLAALLSIAIFISCQITMFYYLLNYNTTIRHILYPKTPTNPYPAPLSTALYLPKDNTK